MFYFNLYYRWWNGKKFGRAGAPMRAASIPSEFQHESPSVTFISSSFLTISTTHVFL
jgi:hypothetical protein